MKNSILQFITAAACVFLVACAKNKDEPAPVTPTVAVNKGSFTWLPNTGSAVTADSAFYYTQFTTIFAFKNGNNSSIEINLSALTVGTYSFSALTGNVLTYINGSSTYIAPSGSCNITAAANNKLSGNFNVNLSGGALTSMSGTFTDILKK